jgi:hypothetical protein
MYTSVDFTSQIDGRGGVSYTNLVSSLAMTLKLDYYYIYIFNLYFYIY